MGASHSIHFRDLIILASVAIFPKVDLPKVLKNTSNWPLKKRGKSYYLRSSNTRYRKINPVESEKKKNRKEISSIGRNPSKSAWASRWIWRELSFCKSICVNYMYIRNYMFVSDFILGKRELDCNNTFSDFVLKNDTATITHRETQTN